jgi:hypothetical protein
MNQSKANDPRFWKKWRKAGAIGTIETAQPGMVRAINNAKSVIIIRDGESVHLIGHFSTGENSEMTLTLTEAGNLLNTGLFKIPGIYGKVLIEQKKVRIWFKPSHSGSDLICLKPKNFVRKLKEVL